MNANVVLLVKQSSGNVVRVTVNLVGMWNSDVQRELIDQNVYNAIRTFFNVTNADIVCKSASVDLSAKRGDYSSPRKHRVSGILESVGDAFRPLQYCCSDVLRDGTIADFTTFNNVATVAFPNATSYVYNSITVDLFYSIV